MQLIAPRTAAKNAHAELFTVESCREFDPSTARLSLFCSHERISCVRPEVSS